MNRRPITRIALASTALLALAACIVNLSFEMKKSLALRTQPGANTVSQNVLVDLGQYSEVTDHKTQIRSLDLDYADASIRTINSGNRATKLNGTLKLRRTLTASPALDVTVGALQDFSITVGATKRLKGTPELDAFLLQQFHELGTFYAVVEGTADDVADFVLDLNLHASIGYDAGLF